MSRHLRSRTESGRNVDSNAAGIRTLSDDEVKGLVGAAEGTHYSFCEPTASWCDDCGDGDVVIFR